MSDSTARQPDTEPDAMLLQHALPGGETEWLLFRHPRQMLTAATLAGVRPLLRTVEEHTRHGGWAAGFVTYEAAPAFDPAFVTHPPHGTLPLASFGLYGPPERFPGFPGISPRALRITPHWKPSISRAAYDAALARIHEEIASGNTYQVNFTLRLSNAFNGNPAALFAALVRAQPTRFAAFINSGEYHIASASPELFFHRRGETISMRPMKGTAPCGKTPEEVEHHIATLQGSQKDRAENLMIVDMVRNDLSRIAKRGSVRVPRLFEIEHYPTLLQMTSIVEAESAASLEAIFAALFPCASVTGAPKVSTMRLIRELESTPRGIYTGAIGFAAPHGEAQFNVAIRTLTLHGSQAEYGTGGGIVWDSNAEAEYAECELKAAVLSAAFAEFRLLETMLWTPERGVFLFDRHLDRLHAAAKYFGFTIDRAAIALRLAAHTGGERSIFRLLLAADGTVTLETKPYPVRASRYWRVTLAAEPVDSTDPFLRHKTTRRAVYDSARAAHPDADDVLFWNERGELTESTLANLVIRKAGALITPPASCGLLPGTYRAELLSRGRIREGIITIDALRQADAIFLINSVRGWIPARLVE